MWPLHLVQRKALRTNPQEELPRSQVAQKKEIIVVHKAPQNREKTKNKTRVATRVIIAAESSETHGKERMNKEMKTKYTNKNK